MSSPALIKTANTVNQALITQVVSEPHGTGGSAWMMDGGVEDTFTGTESMVAHVGIETHALHSDARLSKDGVQCQAVIFWRRGLVENGY
jgi:hypothetical protein